jgi:hypothetical protein
MHAHRFSVTLAGLAILTACGGSPDPQASVKNKDDKSTLPALSVGTVQPDALGSAHCTLEPDGAWHANGTVKNTSTKTLSFDVRIHVGPADGKSGPAHVQRVDEVKPGKEVPWSVPNVTAADPAGPCQIQVAVAK